MNCGAWFGWAADGNDEWDESMEYESQDERDEAME